MRTRSKTNLIILFSVFLLAVVLFVLINLFTFTYRGAGYGISGNGNLGLLFVYPAIPVYVVMLVFVYKVGRTYLHHFKNMIVLSVIFVIVLILCVYGEYELVHSLFNHLRTGPFPPEIYTFPWPLYQYTNTVYFNFFTFTSGVLLTLLISSFVEIFRRRK